MTLLEQVSNLAKLVGIEILLVRYEEAIARNKHAIRLNLEKSVGSRKSAQSLGAPRMPVKALFTNEVTTASPNLLGAPRASTSFSHSTDISRLKSDGSWLTHADLEANEKLCEALPKIVDYPVLSEEMSERLQADIIGSKAANYWCIDPLDGTSNFSLGIPYWCTSIALIENGKQALAVVFDANRNECFAASAFTNTTLNGIQVSSKDPSNNIDLSCAMGLIDFKRLASSMSSKLVAKPPYRSQRSFGASALDLCWIAANRCQVYLHGRQKLWDHAAGLLILKNAGGFAETFNGNDVFSNELKSKSVIAASNRDLMKQWKNYFQSSE